jgi:hypothetical protein
MKVKELIEHLQTLDPELYVFKPGYEGGIDYIEPGKHVINVELNHYTEWYYGKHEEIDEPIENSVKGIIL